MNKFNYYCNKRIRCHRDKIRYSNRITTFFSRLCAKRLNRFFSSSVQIQLELIFMNEMSFRFHMAELRTIFVCCKWCVINWALHVPKNIHIDIDTGTKKNWVINSKQFRDWDGSVFRPRMAPKMMTHSTPNYKNHVFFQFKVTTLIQIAHQNFWCWSMHWVDRHRNVSKRMLHIIFNVLYSTYGKVTTTMMTCALTICGHGKHERSKTTVCSGNDGNLLGFEFRYSWRQLDKNVPHR